MSNARTTMPSEAARPVAAPAAAERIEGRWRRALRSVFHTSPAAAENVRTDDRRWTVNGYLTDGVNLYRFVGWALGGRMAHLEDCRSLELIAVPACELRHPRLRPVAPAGV